MINIASWLEKFCGRLDEKFSGRICFLGLQGSYARGEAKESSDIDYASGFDEMSERLFVWAGRKLIEVKQ